MFSSGSINPAIRAGWAWGYPLRSIWLKRMAEKFGRKAKWGEERKSLFLYREGRKRAKLSDLREDFFTRSMNLGVLCKFVVQKQLLQKSLVKYAPVISARMRPFTQPLYACLKHKKT